MLEYSYSLQVFKNYGFGISNKTISHLQLIGSYSVQDVRGLNSHSVFSNFLECLKHKTPPRRGFDIKALLGAGPN